MELTRDNLMNQISKTLPDLSYLDLETVWGLIVGLYPTAESKVVS